MSIASALKCLYPTVIGSGDSARVFPCGHCPSCLRRKSQEWSLRACHELNDYNFNACFITLTYNNYSLLIDSRSKPTTKVDKAATLCYDDVKYFFMRLRSYFIDNDIKLDKELKYIGCAEYGPKTFRPHYHFCLFGLNYDYPHLKEILESCWKMGFVHVSKEQVTTNGIQYINGYVRKKVPSRLGGKKLYQDNYRLPPKLFFSKGLGKNWALRNVHHWAQTLTTGFNGHQVPIPRSYINWIKASEGKIIRDKVSSIIRVSEDFSIGHRQVKAIELDSEKLETRFRYRVLPNVNGKFTSIILKTQFKNLSSLIITSKTEKLLPSSFIKTLEIEFNRQKEQYKNYFRNYNSSAFTLPREYFAKTREKDYTPLQKKRSYLSYLATSADQYNLEIERGRFGARDKLDSLFDLYDLYEYKPPSMFNLADKARSSSVGAIAC